MDTLVSYLSPEYLLIFFLKMYVPAGENFQIYGVNITRKCICESKNWAYSFSL